ncbi:MAG: tyrosine-type recombinase/integrase [Egibacteraceae bacterium]
MAAACRLRCTPRQAAYATLVGLLAATGPRVGEAIRPDRDDVCWDPGLLTVRRSKLDKSRQLPLHPTTVEALRGYARRRGQLCPEPKTASFFVSTAGTRLIYSQRVVHVCDPRVPRRAGAPLATMPAADPRPAPHLRGGHPDRLAPRRNGGPAPLLSTASATSTPNGPTGTCRRPRSCSARPPSASRTPGASWDELARAHSAGVAHRAAGKPTPGQPAHHHRLP